MSCAVVKYPNEKNDEECVSEVPYRNDKNFANGSVVSTPVIMLQKMLFQVVIWKSIL